MTTLPELPDEDLLRLDLQICFSLNAASRAFGGVYRTILKDLGLTYPQYLVMLVLWEADNGPAVRRTAIGVGELGERLYLDSGTLTPLLKRMEVAGLLRRTRAADDERRVIVTLTSVGRALRRRAEAVPLQVACATGCQLAEISALTSQLQALRSNVAGHLEPAAA